MKAASAILPNLSDRNNGKDDLPLAEVNGELVRAFEFYLKTERNVSRIPLSVI